MTSSEFTPSQSTSSMESQSADVRAMKLFALVSVKYPLADTTQAAEMALACQRSGDSPRQLYESLSGNPALIQQLTDWGNRVHTNKNNPEAPTSMSTKQVVSIVRRAFISADILVNLESDDLQQIIESSIVDGKKVRDGIVREQADKMLEIREQALGKKLPRLTDYVEHIPAEYGAGGMDPIVDKLD